MCKYPQATAGAIAYHGITNLFGGCQAKPDGGAINIDIGLAATRLQNQSAPHLLVAFCDSQKLPPDSQRMKRWPVGFHKPDLS